MNLPIENKFYLKNVNFPAISVPRYKLLHLIVDTSLITIDDQMTTKQSLM